MQNDYLSNKKKYISNIEFKNYQKKNQYPIEHKKVDINNLLNRIKLDQKKKIKDNFIYMGLISFIIVTTAFVTIL